MGGVGAPHPEGGDLIGDVGEAHRAVGGQVAAGPELVASAVEHAGDDAHPLGAHPHHGQIGVEPAVGGQPRGVNGAAHCHVHLVDRQIVGVGHRAGPAQLEDLKGAQVHHPAVLPQVEVLGHGDGAPPPGVPFHLPALHLIAVHQIGVRLEPLGPLPGAGLEELGPQFLLSGEVGADPEVAAALPLLLGMHDAVGLVEVLRGAGPDVIVAPLLGVEAGHVGAVDVDHPGVAEGHPLGHHLGHARPLLDPDGRGRPQVADLGQLAQTRHGVGGERQQSIDGVLDLGVAQHVHQVDGLLHLKVEVVVGERHLGGRKGGLLVGGDLVGVVEDGPVGVRPHLHRPGRLALVAEGVHVPNDGIADLVVGLGQDVERADVHHLVHRGHQRDVGVGHVGHPVRPHPAGDHHVLGLDGALVGDHRFDRAVAGVGTVFGDYVEHLGVGRHMAAAVHRDIAHLGAGLQRVHHRHRGAVEALQNDVGVDERHQLLYLFGSQNVGLHPPGGGRCHAPLELVDALSGPGHLDAAGVNGKPQVAILVGALHPQQAHLLVVVHREDEVGGVAGGPAGVGQRALVQQYQIGPPQLAQVPDQAVAHDSRTDYYALGLLWDLSHVLPPS